TGLCRTGVSRVTAVLRATARPSAGRVRSSGHPPARRQLASVRPPPTERNVMHLYAAASMLLAQQDGEGGMDETITDLEDAVEDAIGGLIPSEALAALITRSLFILLIILIAIIASTLARRGIARMVDRMKDPDAPRGRRLRAKIGMPDAAVADVRRAQRADSLGALATSVVSVVIWTMALIMVLGHVGIQVGPLIAGAGIVGVAVGFGAQ